MNDEKIKIACIGGGTIGSSWAVNFLIKGYAVSLYDVSQAQLDKSKLFILDSLKFLSDKNVIGSKSIEELFSNIIFTESLSHAVKDTILIQESGPESYEVKKDILSRVDLYAPENAIFASSTSGLLITKIAEESKFPERCIGAHPYNPPHLIPLVEITKGTLTSDIILKKAYELYKSMGKEPVILNKESLGFLGNRLSFALYREMISLVINGYCSVEDIDKVVSYGIGIRWAILGPAMLYDLGGGDAGIRGMSKLDFTLNQVFKDLSSLSYMPKEWYDFAEKGLELERKNLPDFVGNSKQEISQFRDNMLVEILKLHKKL
jgi:3-hydroxyacyl-CoA dehydrogenase